MQIINGSWLLIMQDHVKAEEKKYHLNIAITAVYDSVYGRLYFVAKTPQAGVKDVIRYQHVTLCDLKKANLVVTTLCHTKSTVRTGTTLNPVGPLWILSQHQMVISAVSSAFQLHAF